jgi:hypothetical protein
MAAMTEDRHTVSRTGDIYSFSIASNTMCYGGTLATVLSTGYVRPGKVDGSSPTAVAVGRFRKRYNNLTATADSEKESIAEVETGIFCWDNYGSDPVTIASLHADCYVYDDHTVAATSATNTRGVAGKVVAIDALGVWVATGLTVV